MRTIGFFWGIIGVIAILLFAIYRISPMVTGMQGYPLSLLHWSSLILFTGYMAYAEGYRGFHRAFAPRVVQRAGYLRRQRHMLLIIFAPLFCMGYFHATPKRIITSFAVTGAIVLLVVLVSQVPQPWRGIIDTGVITGLMIGIGSIVFFTVKILYNEDALTQPADLPDQN